MRCATLAESWIGGGLGAVRMCGEITLPFVARRLRELGADVSPGHDQFEETDVLIVDSYCSSIRAQLTQTRARLRVAVDDVGEWMPPQADVIWNPNPYGSLDLYPTFGGRVLTGAECVPVRSGLPAWTPRECEGTAVALGGSALTDRIREPVIAALAAASFQPVVGVGEWIPSDWTAADENAPWKRFASCCRAVVGAGTSTWEAAVVGIPTVVVCSVPNQRLAFEWALASGAATVDLTTGDRTVTADRLSNSLGTARPLPKIRNGAGHVASTLHSLARGRVVS